MHENNIDPAQDARPDPASREQTAQKPSTRITPMRALVGVLLLLLLCVSIIGSLLGTSPSYARTNDSPAGTPTNTTSAGPNSSFIPTVDCTVTPTDPSCITPTATPVTPTATPTPPTVTPTPTPKPKPTNTPTPRPTATPRTTPTVTASPSATASVSPTDTATAAPGQGGGGSTPGPVPTSGPSSPNGNGGGQGGSGFPIGTVLIVIFALLGLALSAGVGWLLFRRMLMPNSEVKVKPSGARPWSRTRVPNPDSVGHSANAGMVNMNAAPGFNGYEQPNPGFGPNGQGFDQMNNGYGQGFDPAMNNGFGPNGQGFDQMNNGYGTGYAPQGMNGYGQVPNGYGTPAAGFGGFSDSFVPPSPQVFPRSDSMIPANTGALPVLGNGNGYAPNSNAFNAMYGMSDDPFAASQGGGSPSWLDSLGGGQNNGFGGQQQPAPNNFAPSEPDINDPYLAEVIRQYSQKGQPVQPPQQQPEQRPGFQNNDWMK